jgi:hypothetical protein
MLFVDEDSDPSVRCADTSPTSLGREIRVTVAVGEAIKRV